MPQDQVVDGTNESHGGLVYEIATYSNDQNWD